MRHAIANLFYRIGRAIDRPAHKDEPVQGQIGEDTGWDHSGTSAEFSMHMRRDVPIGGNFSNNYGSTHANLKVGKGNVLTLFLERESTLRLLGVLEEIERRYKRYGEHGWRS